MRSELALVEPLVPLARQGGRRRETDDARDAQRCHVRAKHGMPMGVTFLRISRRAALSRYFRDWGINGALDRIHDALCQKCRDQAEREARPTAAISTTRA